MVEDTDGQLSQAQFLRLANQAGFELSEADLAQLTRRNLLCPLPAGQGAAPSFHLLHLYSLERYFAAIRPIRHPWAAATAELTLNDVNEQAQELGEVAGALVDTSAEVDAGQLEVLAARIRDQAERIDPFGPIGDLLELLRPQVRRELCGDGLLYCCLVELADELEQRARPGAEQAEPTAEEPTDNDVAGSATPERPAVPELKDEDRATAEVEEKTEPPRPPDEVEVDKTGEDDGTDVDEPSGADAPSDADDLADEGGLDEESVEPAIAGANEFSRDNSQVTSRTKDLETRLERLRSRDKVVAAKRRVAGPQESDEPSAPPAEASEPDDLAERIAELNRLREQYLAEQEWEKLTELYEEGLELFSEPVERQQVLLTLAMVYEVKLGEPNQAFERFTAAHREQGSPEGRKKAFEGLQRVGRQPPVRQDYVDWLEQRLTAEDLEADDRARLQRLLALALHQTGRAQRAFYTYTAFVSEASADQIDDRALDDLEKLAGGVDADQLASFYSDLLAYELPEDVFEALALRACRHHAERGEVDASIGYYERLLERIPDHEVAFYGLAQLYEETERWERLVVLYHKRIERLGDEAPESLRSELERAAAMT